MNSNTSTPPADLLAHVEVLREQLRIEKEFQDSLPETANLLESDAVIQALSAAITALSAHRGEVEPAAVVFKDGNPMWLASWLESQSYWHPPTGTKLYFHPPQAQVLDGSMTVDDAVNAVAELFPGADKQALRVLAKALTKPPQAQAGAGMIRSGYRHVAHELVLNIKRAAIRGRNSDDESSYIATCDHIENLADEALSYFAALEASHEPE